jgi:hypothetical protein
MMCSRLTRLTLLAVVLLVPGCESGPRDAEVAACEAAEGLLTANDRETLRARVGAMVRESERAGNRTLEEAARAYEEALDDRDEGDGAAAIGRFYDECQRMELDVPGG